MDYIEKQLEILTKEGKINFYIIKKSLSLLNIHLDKQSLLNRINAFNNRRAKQSCPSHDTGKKNRRTAG